MRRSSFLSKTGIAVAVSHALSVNPVHATIFNVDSASDCSLVDAIIAANTNQPVGSCAAGSNAATDTINLLSDVSFSTGHSSNSFSALPPINSNLVLNGNNHEVSRLASAVSGFRLFTIAEGGDVIINDLSVSGGGFFDVLVDGGGFYVADQARLELNNTTVSGNQLTLLGATGGGIAAHGELHLNSASLLNNSARGGGALDLVSASVTITNSTLTGNSASSGGAILSGIGTNLQISNSTISANTAITGAGILSNSTSLVYVQNGSLISGNSATRGAAISMSGTSSLTLANSTVSDNNASRAAGIDILGDASLTVSESQVRDNTANDTGGGIRIYDNGRMSIINSSTLSGNSAMFGGALSALGSASITIQNSTVEYNSASRYGGAMDITGDAKLYFSNSQLINNTAARRGGAMRLRDTAYASFLLAGINSNLVSSSTGGVLGGGIFAEGTSHLKLVQSSVSGNQASGLNSAAGAGISLSESSFLELYSSTIAFNQGQTTAAYTGSEGGGVRSFAMATMTIINSTISNNSALFAAGISAGGSQATIVNCTISDNTASSIGGGISITTGTTNLTNNLVFGNQGSGQQELRLFGGASVVSSNNLFGDSSKTNDEALSTNFVLGVSDITATYNGTLPTLKSNIAGTLQLNGGSTMTHALAMSSPALNAGRSSACPAKDQAGQIRDNPCDIGAYEIFTDQSCFVVRATNGNVLSFCL